ncbi:MAG: LytTR family transcriptional regulator DNA-binding domain-containing protein [Muribaculaceae bacterium]|nr:LytTR family transcriptional regulator DNA-binding domain-containing protein [Muribaculaceae bacterium]MCM1398979.1 LytTR family transcriptional regulator DNA-binding domain-containing protein [Clostridium sp.]MCM1458837.1 LytTR family transcriptional regulator DNA-binding domain-containing protein [Bacteroides sp.]
MLIIVGDDDKKSITVGKGESTQTIQVEDIYYIESNDHKVSISLGDKCMEFYGRLTDLEEALKPDFFRVHKGYLVNLNFIERYNRTDIYMKNGDMLSISKYKYQDFVKAYTEYFSKH